MTVLNILIAPHPILSKPSQPLDNVLSHETQQQLSDMVETMHADHGIGLAANQVGILKQMIVMNVGDNNSLTSDVIPIEPKLYYFINPKIEWLSEETSVFEEGCLSIPGKGIAIERPCSLQLRYLDEQGHECLERFHGLQARCIQHEIDHLEGKTMLDYVSKLKKDLMIKKLNKDYPKHIIE